MRKKRLSFYLAADAAVTEIHRLDDLFSVPFAIVSVRKKMYN